MKISVDKNKYIKYKISYLDNKIDELIDAGLFNEVEEYESEKDKLIRINNKIIDQDGGSFFKQKITLRVEEVFKKFLEEFIDKKKHSNLISELATSFNNKYNLMNEDKNKDLRFKFIENITKKKIHVTQ